MAETQTTRTPSATSGIPRPILILAGFALAWIVVSGMREISNMIAPVFLALNLIIVAYPIKRSLTRKGMPEWFGATLAMIAVLIALLAFFAALGWAMTALVDELPNYKGKFDELYQQALQQATKFGISEKQITEQLSSVDSKSIMGWVGKAASAVSSAASLLAVIVTILFFLAMDAMGFERRMELASRHHSGFIDALVAFGRGVRRYWIVATVFGLIVAVLDYIALIIVGVPLALVWAVLSFVTNYIPNIGFVFGLVPPALMALLDKGPVAAIVVVAAYSVLNFVVQSIIQPKVAGEAVGITATLSFISLLFWAWALGPLGAILALPATLLLKAVLVDGDEGSRWINALIAADPKTCEADDAQEAAGFDDDDDKDDKNDDRMDKGGDDEHADRATSSSHDGPGSHSV